MTEPEEEKEEQKNETEASDSSIDSNVFVNEKKSFIEEEFNWEAAFALYGILAGVVLVFLGPTLYIFISQDIYFKEMNYIWVSAYFIA